MFFVFSTAVCDLSVLHELQIINVLNFLHAFLGISLRQSHLNDINSEMYFRVRDFIYVVLK
jgi:hypothetical protein